MHYTTALSKKPATNDVSPIIDNWNITLPKRKAIGLVPLIYWGWRLFSVVWSYFSWKHSRNRNNTHSLSRWFHSCRSTAMLGCETLNLVSRGALLPSSATTSFLTFAPLSISEKKKNIKGPEFVLSIDVLFQQGNVFLSERIYRLNLPVKGCRPSPVHENRIVPLLISLLFKKASPG